MSKYVQLIKTLNVHQILSVLCWQSLMVKPNMFNLYLHVSYKTHVFVTLILIGYNYLWLKSV